MARRSDNRGFASLDPERRRRIASEGGRSSHGGHRRGYEDEYDEDYDDDYDEDEDRNCSNRHGNDYDDEDRWDEDDYENTGYEDEDEYDEDDDDYDRHRSSRGGRRRSGRRGSGSRRGFASMDPEQQRRIARMGGEATARTHGRDFYEEIGHEGGEAVRD